MLSSDPRRCLLQNCMTPRAKYTYPPGPLYAVGERQKSASNTVVLLDVQRVEDHKEPVSVATTASEDQSTGATKHRLKIFVVRFRLSSEERCR